uniref:EF-hand domain-containing protein n=1 Tax=Haptolina brevifila TaxID=156173 RepID=A0A7S2IJD3_9EUKA
MKEWDPNNDGSVTKQEFRLSIRKLFGKTKVDTKEVDSLFQRLDADGGGALNTSELKSAFKSLKDTASNSEEKTASQKATAEKFRQRAEQYRELAAVAHQSEQAATKLLETRKGTVGSKVGAAINAKNTKLSDIMKQWDASGDGELSKSEFRNNVLSLGVKDITDTDIDGLFDSLDSDGGGALDMDEVKKAIKRLQEQANTHRDLVREESRSYIALVKATRVAQNAFWRQLKDEEAQEEAS